MPSSSGIDPMFDMSMAHLDLGSLSLIPDRVSLAPRGEWPIDRESSKRPLKSEIDIEVIR